MRPNMYMRGRVIPRGAPEFKRPMNNIKLTFDLARDDKNKELITADSHLSGQAISRFTHIHRKQEDLLKKQEMTRTLCRLTPALYSALYEGGHAQLHVSFYPGN